MGWPAGRRWGVAGWAGTAQERCEACFSAVGCDWEWWVFGPPAAQRGPNIFLFASEVVEKNRGWRARFLSIFGRFWVFGDLSGLCVFVHIIFVTSRFPKPYVFFAAKARPCPPQAPVRARANIFHFDSKWSKKIGASLHRPAPHRLLVDPNGPKELGATMGRTSPVSCSPQGNSVAEGSGRGDADAGGAVQAAGCLLQCCWVGSGS